MEKNIVVPAPELWAVPPAYEGSTWVCIASGSSLHDAQVEHARLAREAGKCRVIVCNNNIFKAPWADHMHFCDRQWFNWYGDREEFKNFKGTMTTCDRTMTLDCPAAKYLTVEGNKPFSDDRSQLGGNSSGQQIINIAALYGAKKIILIGYDCKPAMRGNYEVMHWFGHHPNKTPISVLPNFIQCFNRLAPMAVERGIDIINCTHDTALECFPRDRIENAVQI